MCYLFFLQLLLKSDHFLTSRCHECAGFLHLCFKFRDFFAISHNDGDERVAAVYFK
eukprot:SAG11_NODE_2879_length_2876_cov_1.398632_4_plen_56_part_00